jgi:hypothetical protein
MKDNGHELPGAAKPQNENAMEFCTENTNGL